MPTQVINTTTTAGGVAGPHATYSSALTQTVASTTTAYPVVFESVDDEDVIYQRNATVTIDIATPALVRWTAHGLNARAAVIFSNVGGALPTGITAGTVYWISSTNYGADSFQIETFGGTAIDTSGSQSGVQNCKCVSRFYVPDAGDYLVIISGLVDTTSNTASTCDLWFDVNGSNVPKSNTIAAINTSGVQVVVTVPIILDLAAGSYVRFFYRGSGTNVQLLAVAEASNPTRPACPSMIMTVQKVGV